MALSDAAGQFAEELGLGLGIEIHHHPGDDTNPMFWSLLDAVMLTGNAIKSVQAADVY